MFDTQVRFDEAQRLINKAAEHFARGSEVWNSIGMDSPQLATEVAEVALREYRMSVDLLEPTHFISLPEQVRNQISVNYELALAHTASAESFLYDQWNDEDLGKMIELVQQEIDHMEQAIRYQKMSSREDTESLTDWQTHVLHSQGRKAHLSARLVARKGELIRARDMYSQAKDIFGQIMELYELLTPELALIREKAQRALDNRLERVMDLDEKEEAHIRYTAVILRTSERGSSLPNEDLYRRTVSNYDGDAAMVANLDAFEILNNGGLPQDVDRKLEESINRTYLAMNVFPGNLEFHQDLFSAWRVRGELFGCPMEETAKYYHIRCPLAIMHYLGHWYMSPTLEYEALRCTVCGKDILECPHYPGEVVDSKIVKYIPQNPNLVSASLVDVPEDPGCRIEWISIPKSYFPLPLRDNPGLRCFFCQSVDEGNELQALFLDLPDSTREQLKARFQQILYSSHYRIVQPAKESNNRMNPKEDST